MEDMRDDVDANTILTTRHETDIGYIKEAIININDKLDILISKKLANL